MMMAPMRIREEIFQITAKTFQKSSHAQNFAKFDLSKSKVTFRCLSDYSIVNNDLRCICKRLNGKEVWTKPVRKFLHQKRNKTTAGKQVVNQLFTKIKQENDKVEDKIRGLPLNIELCKSLQEAL